MSSIYALTADMMQLLEMLENPIDAEDEAVLIDTLFSVQGEYEIKLEAYCKVIKNLEADMEAIKAEVKRLTDRRKVLEHNVERLKKAMFDSMKATNTDKVKGDLFTIAIQKNGGKLPVIVDVDTAELPNELVKVVESPDLEAIAKLLDKGNSPYAHYGERGESLRIR